ncbi:hypothetical protein QEN19_001221 [Hanseniaspora menglaensis]
MQELNRLLENVLPKGSEFEIYHLKSPSREINGFRNQKFKRYDAVIKCSHFLAIAYNGKIFFAIDVNIYFEVMNNSMSRTFFVSKADTNGFLDDKNVKISLIVETFLYYLIKLTPACYLEKVIPHSRNYKFFNNQNIITKKTTTKNGFQILSERCKPSNTYRAGIKDLAFKKFNLNNTKTFVTKISLFTRPEPHYLFTGSGNNSKKHLLSGENLLKWWLRIVDSLSKNQELFKQDENLLGTLELPGEDSGFVERRYLKQLSQHWKRGSIYGQSEDPLFEIPIFHDDPKTRFLKDLIVELKYDLFHLKDFWRELEVRQEFRSGIVVGVIGVSGMTPLVVKNQNPSELETLIAPSKAKYKQIKSYVVGEEYDEEEGAIDARDNLREIWLSFQKTNFSVTGKYVSEKNMVLKKPNEINVVTFRRKPKSDMR